MVESDTRSLFFDAPIFWVGSCHPPQHTYTYTYTVFTHRDHIGCHAEWHTAFPDAKRVIHEADMVVNDHGDTSGFEMVLSGFGGKREWTLPGCVLFVCIICVGTCMNAGSRLS